MENTTPLVSPEIQLAFKNYSVFLKDVRKRLILTLIVFALATILGFFFYETIIKFLISILSLRGINIVFTSPFQFISLALSAGLACGIIISFPLMIFQILSFLKPALKRNEFSTIIKLLPLSLLFFIFGVLFGFFIMKWQISIFLERSEALGIGNILDISKLLKTVIITSVLMGVGFQFPIVLTLLLKLNIINRSHLLKNRRWAYLGAFLFAILLPADSIIADIIMALPIIVLFELILVWSKVKKV